jgi:undecaprenyl-diphosphatase
MNLFQAIILGIVEGITEFLPISSTGHLTITEGLMGLPVDDPGVTAFTAIIQVGAIAAVFVYFWADIVRLATAWGRGIVSQEARGAHDYRFAWYVIWGSIPIGIVGFLGRDVISGPLRNLWVVVAALLLWSVVMVVAERVATRDRPEQSVTLADTLVIGVIQCLALIPGVSRSGATISGGLFRGLDRVAATRLSFFLSIPALLAAGAYEGVTEFGAISDTVGWVPTLVGTVVSFGVAYVAIAWLLRFVQRHSIAAFVPYRVGLAVVVAILLLTGVISAT